MPVRTRLNDLDGKEWVKFTRSWFSCNPPRRKIGEIEHPAKFPEDMAESFIGFFTKTGETVLDPFVGVGSTMVAAERLGRRSVGFEVSEEFVWAAHARLKGGGPDSLLVHEDARNAAQLLQERGLTVDMILTSPPYWNMLGKSRGGSRSAHKTRHARGLRTVYGDDPRDLGNIESYDDFVAVLHGILDGMRQVLARGRYLVVVCQNVRVPEGVVRPLAWDLAARLSETWQFKGERIWVQDNKPLGIWGFPSEFVTNVHHHYCLVFKNA